MILDIATTFVKKLPEASNYGTIHLIEVILMELEQIIHWGMILAPFAVGLLASWLIHHMIGPRLARRAEEKGHLARGIMLRAFTVPLQLEVALSGLLLTLQSLLYSHTFYLATAGKIYYILTVILLSRGLWASSGVCRLLLDKADRRLSSDNNQILVRLLVQLYQLGVIALAGMMIMEALGFPVSGLITGVGLVGLTVSLGAQESASNLFAGIILVIERPFSIGDWIVVDNIEGAVEDISLRSTRIRTLENTLVTVPNAKISSANITNASKRQKWLFRFTIGLTYDTTRAAMEEIIAALDAMLRSHETVLADSVLVKMSGFSDSSLDITVESFLNVQGKPAYLEAKNQIYLDVLDTVRDHGGDFAFPSTTVYLQK